MARLCCSNKWALKSQWLSRLVSHSKYMSIISWLGFFSIPSSLLDPSWERRLCWEHFSCCSRGKRRHSELQTGSKRYFLRETHQASAHHSLPKQVLWYLLGSTGQACIIVLEAWAPKAMEELTEKRRLILLPFQREIWIGKRRERAEPREHPAFFS